MCLLNCKEAGPTYVRVDRMPHAHTKAPRKVIFQELGGAKGLRKAVDIFYHKVGTV